MTETWSSVTGRHTVDENCNYIDAEPCLRCLVVYDAERLVIDTKLTQRSQMTTQSMTLTLLGAVITQRNRRHQTLAPGAAPW